MSPVEKYIARGLQIRSSRLALIAMVLAFASVIAISVISNAFSFVKHREQLAAYRECLSSRHQLLTEMPGKVESSLFSLECRL